MSGTNDTGEEKNPIARRTVLQKSAVTGGALLSLTGTASASDVSSVEEILNSETVTSIERKVPNFRARPENARITAESDQIGRTIEVSGQPGTLHATELVDGTVVAVFRFPEDVPRRELNGAETVPDGSQAMLIGSQNGAHLLRSASPLERRQILRTVDAPDTEDVRVTTTSESDEFEVSHMDLDAGRITQTVVRPQRAPSTTANGQHVRSYEIVSESVVTAGGEHTDNVTAQSCDCGELLANIVLCFHSLSGCKTALSCGAFGGPKVIVACAIANGCIYSILSEMFLSEAPGCVNLGQDLWNLCATECVY